MTIVLGIFEQGLIYAIMALGVYITYKILDFPDLTVDGSFPLGAALTALLITNGWDPFLCLLLSFLAGLLAGTITGLIHVKCHVRDLLSGIITMTALYSVNLHIAGSSNVPIFNMNTVFSNPLVNSIFPAEMSAYVPVILLFLLVLLCKILMDLYLKTKSGFLLRAVGDNNMLVTTLAKDSGGVKILGLALANGLVALAGGVMCQYQHFFQVSMGTGTIVIGLASVIIGTNLFKNVSFLKATTTVLIGSILYKACVAIAISCGLNPTDMNLVSAVLFLAILVLGRLGGKKKVKLHD